MKIPLQSLSAQLDERITSFAPLYLDETEYAAYQKIASNGFILTDRWVLKPEKKKVGGENIYRILPISTHVRVDSCQRDIISGERSYCVAIFDGEKEITVSLPSDILTAQGCKMLLTYGVVYCEATVRDLLTYLANSAYQAPLKNVHSRLGWWWEGEKPIFLANRSISQSDFASNYSGQIDLTPKGSLDEWLRMVRSHVLKIPGLLFLLLLGFASPILGYINHFTDLGCLMFVLSNASSKGKTTAAMLAASVFGTPALDRGFVTTLNSTANALTAFVAQADSHTVIIDEAAACGDDFPLNKVMYQLCSGKERMRLNTDGSMKEAKTFNSVILTTSEASLFKDSTPSGILARVFEIIDPLTRNAEHSDRIKACVYQNYGAAGVRFIEWLVASKMQNILADYEAAKGQLLESYRKDLLWTHPLTKRMLSKLAVVSVTADYVAACFDLHIDRLQVDTFILNLAKRASGNADIARNALDCVTQYLTRHSDRFLKKDFSSSSILDAHRLEGTITSRGDHSVLCILKQVLEELLTEGGFEPKAVYRAWKERKILRDYEKDRPYKRMPLVKGGEIVPCFTITITTNF